MSSSTVTSISVASIFMTRPLLFLGLKPTVVSAITTFLQEFFRVSGGKSQTLKLRYAILPTLPEIAAHCNADTIALMKAYFGHVHPIDRASITSANLAVPIPLALACHFFGFAWNDWFMSIGGSEFELVLDPRYVYVVKKANGCIGVVWTNPTMFKCVIRPSATVQMQNSYPSLPAVVNSYSEDSDISRPSSRSSNYSSFSFYSHSSASSQSSIASFDATHTPAKFKQSATPSPVKTTLTAITNTYSTTPKSLNTPAVRAKTASTRYLYQGGMSAVLTGGVMLGTS